jgi:acyl carrier protein
MSDVADRLETIFGDLILDERVPVRQRTRLNCAKWDSLVQLNLILALEQEFHVVVSDDEIMELNSFEVALQLVQDKLMEQGR